MACEDVRAALAMFDTCAETQDGSRVTTHCLYPSFEPVNVFVARYGEGFRVHDGGGAARSAWVHGRNDALITRMLNRYAARYQVAVVDSSLVADVPSAEWLANGVLAVANAAAAAANAALEKVVSATEAVLRDRIFAILNQTPFARHVAPSFELTGRSGKRHRFDFAIALPDARRVVIIDAVAPHHISVSSKYVAFSDTGNSEDGELEKFAVHDQELPADDIALLSQVAALVPVKSLQPGVMRALEPRGRGFPI